VTRKLVEGENLTVLMALRASLEGRVGLCYCDPPFFTQRDHRSKSGEVVFEDKWEDMSSYIYALRLRLEAIKPLLAPWGSVVVHVDSRVNAYVRVAGDSVFGCENFASEVVWRYRRWPSKTPNFQRVHDTLLRWRADVGVEPRFVQLYEAPAASTLKTWGTGKQLAVLKNGKRHHSSTTAEPSPGVPLGDVWDIGVIAPVAKERVDFPTQKPEALLHRLISSLSQPGDLVLDPYVGSGTTCVVAERLGRGWVGVDKSPAAIRTAEGRLAKLVVEEPVHQEGDV
jgi:adenine specific DNA methylase Mod